MDKLIESDYIELCKASERRRFKIYYEKHLAIKVNCPICGKELTKGSLAKHQLSRLCKKPGDKPISENKREYNKESSKEWRLEHEGHVREYEKEYYEKNKAQILQRKKEAYQRKKQEGQ